MATHFYVENNGVIANTQNRFYKATPWTQVVNRTHTICLQDVLDDSDKLCSVSREYVIPIIHKCSLE